MNMSLKLLALCVVGFLLKEKLPYAATVSGIVILLITGRGLLGFVQHRRRLARLVTIKTDKELTSSPDRLTRFYGVI